MYCTELVCVCVWVRSVLVYARNLMCQETMFAADNPPVHSHTVQFICACNSE